jgi:hypothetical protein
MQGKQYLIIISSGKSGSYLTMGLLDWHPEVIVFPRQENLVTQWLSMQKKILYGNDASFGLKTLPFQEIEFESIRTYYTQNYLRFLDMSDGKSREIARKDGIDYSNIDYSILLSKISDARPKQDKITIIEWLDILFDAYKESVEKYRMRPVKYFVFKTIEPELFARYTDIFPEAKFIHLVRHPYDVFNAFKRNTIINKKLNYFRPDFDLLEYALEEKIKTLFENVNIADRNKNMKT